MPSAPSFPVERDLPPALVTAVSTPVLSWLPTGRREHLSVLHLEVDRASA